MGPDREDTDSFSTGPQSMPTHWKQTIFMLPEPITVVGGAFTGNISVSSELIYGADSTVTGSFWLRKRENNSRELDVEIHYAVKLNAETPATEPVVRKYTVR